MIFISFILSYLTASAITFYIDLEYPELREVNPNKKPDPDYIGGLTMEYSKLLRVGIYNCMVSMPFFWHYEYLTRDQNNDNYFIYNFLGWLIITDIIFYTTHRILHLPRFYKYHSLHHSYKYTFGPSAIYASPEEFFFGNLGPSIISFQILQLSHLEMTFIIIFQTFYTVIISHGGYKFIKTGHLQHHINNRTPYGLLISDRVVNLFTS
jgi:sterol desaturase/sphingolipid hydroxylase (fatty acid hydroxylase superfamily)